MTNPKFKDHVPQKKIGDHVEKTSGDYTFFGDVVSVFRKNSGAIRYVVENNAGILLIMSGGQFDE